MPSGEIAACSSAPTKSVIVRKPFGWHTHPGPVFITVEAGELWFHEYDDPTCTPTMVKGPNGGYVDSGHGHIAVNPFTQPAKDVTVVIAPVGLPFRNELDPPPACDWLL